MKRLIAQQIKKIKETSSSKTMITFFVLAFILPLIILLIVTSAFALNSYQRQTAQTLKQMASYFLAETDDSLDNIEQFLVKNATENYEFNRLAHDDQAYKDTDYQLFRTRFYLSLRQNIDLYPNSQYMFFYQKEAKDLLLVSSTDFLKKSSVGYSEMTRYLSDYFMDEPAPQGPWKLMTVNGEEQLFRILQIGNCYLGTNVPINALLGKLEKYDLSNCTFRIEDSYQQADAPQPITSLFEDSHIHMDSREGNYSISLTINQRNFLTPALIAYCSILLFSVLLLCLVPFSHQFLKKQFYTPLQILVEHMEKIENGNIDEKLPGQLGGAEMSHVAQTFNSMMEQIQHLRIQIYEEKLAQSQLELQCLHLQLNPHFFLNTLNSAYLLIKTGNTENLKSLLRSLTGYFRSIFQCTSDTHALSSELEQCRNYICIYQIRCFKEIRVVYNIDDTLYDKQIPPMCILTFLENSIKYAMEDLNSLCITVSVLKTQADEASYVDITIQDNGIGFPAETLTELNEELAAQPLTGSHIGIRNLLHRLYYLYRENASIAFSNVDSGGAQIMIHLPIQD